MTYQDLQDTAKAVLRGRNQIRKNRETQAEGNNMVKNKINKTENKQTKMEKINAITKTWFFEKINKLIKLQPAFTRGKKRHNLQTSGITRGHHYRLYSGNNKRGL